MDFNRLDLNKDGLLHFEEIVNGMSRTGTSSNRVRARAFFSRVQLSLSLLKA